MLGSKKQQFYVQFLGWVETSGLRGTRYTEPVISDLRRKVNKWKYAPKLTLQVGKKEMKITQDIPDEKKKAKRIKTIKFPIIPSRDITFATQTFNPVTGLPDDIVACIYLGYVPRTQRYVHVHVYRFDSPDTATTFVRFLNHIISMHADRTAEIERQLAQQGHIESAAEMTRVPIHVQPRTTHRNFRLESSDGMSDRAFYEDSGADTGSFSDEGFPSGSDEIEPDLQSLKDAVPYDSVTDELKARLRLIETQEAAPILLPPKDYDTIVRRHGDLDKAKQRKCLQIPIVGAQNKQRNGSNESGIEVPSPTSSDGQRNSSDMSDEKIAPMTNGSRELMSVTSPRNKDIYPPKESPLSPRGSDTSRTSSGFGQYRGGLSRQTSSTSGVSNRSSENFSAIDKKSTVIYNGGRHITDIPPADYDDDTPVMRQKSAGMYTPRGVTKSTPVALLQPENDYVYAVVQKRTNRLSATAQVNAPMQTRVDMDYNRPAGPTGVRRVNSMYR